MNSHFGFRSVGWLAAGLLLGQVAQAANHPPKTSRVRKTIAAQITPMGQQVLAVNPVHGNATLAFWAVLTGQIKAPHHNPFPRQTNLRLNLYRWDDGRPALGSTVGPLVDPRFPHDGSVANVARLRSLDLNHNGRDELTVQLVLHGASWQPSCLFVFAVRNGLLEPVGVLTSQQEIALKQSAPGRAWTMVCSYPIGSTLAHYEQPRWRDYYQYDGKRLVLADRQFRHTFAAWPKKLRAALKNHPNDPELWYYLGKAYALVGQKKNARMAYEKAHRLGYHAGGWRRHQAGLVSS